MLRLTRAQTLNIAERRDADLVSEIMAFLRRTGPFDGPHLSDDDLQTLSRNSLHRGRELGLRLKKKLCMFAWLVRETGGHALTAPEIETALTGPGVNPHMALDEILNVMKLCAEMER